MARCPLHIPLEAHGRAMLVDWRRLKAHSGLSGCQLKYWDQISAREVRGVAVQTPREPFFVLGAFSGLFFCARGSFFTLREPGELTIWGDNYCTLGGVGLVSGDGECGVQLCLGRGYTGQAE